MVRFVVDENILLLLLIKFTVCLFFDKPLNYIFIGYYNYY